MCDPSRGLFENVPSFGSLATVYIPHAACPPIVAKVLALRGDSFQHFGKAAVVQSIVDRLPEIAREVASPLAKTEKVRQRVLASTCPRCFLQQGRNFGMTQRVIGILTNVP